MIYDINGNQISIVYGMIGDHLSQAYDVDGNELFETLVVNPDASTGTSTGWSLESANTGDDYVIRLLKEFTPVTDELQSVGYNPDNGKYYKFNGSTTVKVYDSNLDDDTSITMPSSAGHNNDACYYNGNFYFPNGDRTTLYVWNVANNTVSTVSVTGVNQPKNGSNRQIDAICDTGNNNGTFYLITRDVYTTDLVHQSDDKLSVYIYSLSTGAATLISEYPWDCVYIQGSTVMDGILYVACNTQTTGSASNYTGITVKVIRTDSWGYVDTFTVSGDFEPEGMDTIPVGTGHELLMGVGKWHSISEAVRFTAPYSLN